MVSDGTFLLCDDGRFVFHPATALDAETVRTLTQRVRRKILKRMAGMGAVPKDAVNEMMARTHGGFSLNPAKRGYKKPLCLLSTGQSL